MQNKIFKNLDEQIEILKSKGLIIKDIEKAKDILFRENYFFINGYRHLFYNNNKKFINGTTFEELYATFVFDRHLRNIMFKYILIVENNIKSIISYQLSRKYGFKEKDYLNISNFDDTPLKAGQVRDVVRKMERQIRVNGRQHVATLHYIDNYGYVPLWVLVKVLSMGIISELFSILKSGDKEQICTYYMIDSETLAIYLSVLANFRNLCAHEDILYDYRPQRKIPDTLCHRLLDISMTDNEYDYGKNDLFALVIILKRMLEPEEFKEMAGEISYEIDILDGKVDSVPLEKILNKIGFPNNWRYIGDNF